MKMLLLQNLYTGGYRKKEVENNYPVRVGGVITFNEDIIDKDYKIYRVKGIEGVKIRKMYRIIKKRKNDLDNWQVETFITGGEIFNFKEAHIVKRKIQRLCSSILYKVERVI